MSETQALFAALRETANAATAAAIERLIKSGADRDLVFAYFFWEIRKDENS